MPSSISGHTEFPGDYLSSLSLILKTRLILLATPSTANFQLLVGKFRMIFLHILQNVSWPPHSSLQDVVDNWIEISIDGGDGWQDNLHQQSHHPPLEKNGNVISMTLFSSEIIELVSGLLTDLKTSSVKISSCPPITGSGDWHEQFVGTFLSSLSPDQGPREPNSQRRAEAFSLQNISPLIQDSELLSKANLYTACPLDISISQCHMRAAIACYLSLKYQSVCSLSSRTQYTCIFSTDPRELPLRGALIIFLHSALWESYIRVRGSTSSHYHKSYSFSDCSHDFFSGFTRFVRLQCSELLIRERSITLLQSPLVSRLVTSSLLATTKEVDVDVIFNFSLQSLLSTHSTVAKVLPPYFHLGPAKMTQITTRLLRVLLHPSFPQNSSATHQSRSPNSSFAPLPNNSSECEVIFHKLWCFWRAIHSIHLMPAQYELAAVNLLLELSESHHPHAICSYSTLVKEPLILFRLPIIWFSHITSANMIFYIFRSVTIASRITCHEAYRVNKSVSKHILSHRLLPKSMTLHKETIASPHITSVPVVARDGSSRLENCDSIDENDFLNLQELMGIRLICEIWTYISQLSRENETTEVVWMQSRLPERVFHAFRSSVSLILRENSALLESLLHYGITSFSSFYLLASGNPTILNLFIDKVNGAISNHTEPYMVAASKSMEQILLHLQYLFICLMEPITTSFRYVLPVQEHIDLTLHAHQTITLFASFLKKSLKFHCWKQQDTANPTLGKELLKCLSIMSSSFPVLTLKMISTCTSQELFASGSSSSPALFSLTSVLGRLQPALLLLQQSILRKIGTISEGVKRTTSDFEDEDMPQEKRVRLGL